MNRSGLRRFLRSFRYAFHGITASLRSEGNLRFHFAVMTLVIFFGVWLRISTAEWLVCILCFALVIGAELVNTAIEHTVDLAAGGEQSEHAKLAKDAAAGAVLFCAICAAAAGLVIFVPKLISLVQ